LKINTRNSLKIPSVRGTIHTLTLFSLFICGELTVGAAPSKPKNDHVSVPIVSDIRDASGVVREDAWSKAAVLAGFTEAGVRGRRFSPQESEVKVLSDHDFLYLQLTAKEPEMGKLKADCAAGTTGLTVWSDDSFEIFIQPNPGEKRFYQIILNPLGARFDNIRPDSSDKSWNSKAETTCEKSSDSWKVSTAIPWTSLGFTDGPPAKVSFNIIRNRPRPLISEHTYSSFVCLDGQSIHRPELFAEMELLPEETPVVNLANHGSLGIDPDAVTLQLLGSGKTGNRVILNARVMGSDGETISEKQQTADLSPREVQSVKLPYHNTRDGQFMEISAATTDGKILLSRRLPFADLDIDVDVPKWNLVVRINGGTGSVLKRATLYDINQGKVAASWENVNVSDTGLQLPLPENASLINSKFTAELKTGNGDAFYSKTIQLETPVGRVNSSLTPTDEEKSDAFQLFVRAEPGEVLENSQPLEDERASELQAWGTPGQEVILYFAVRSLDKPIGVKPVLGNFQSAASGESLDLKGDFRVAKQWRQRREMSGNNFWSIPEMLLKIDNPIEIPAETTKLFRFRVRIPEETNPGEYIAPLSIGAKKQNAETSLRLKVLPFKLEEPNQIWGLYPDNDRYNDNQARCTDTFRLIRENGFNTLILTIPFWEWKFENGQILPNFDRIDRIVSAYRDAGFTKPPVLYLWQIDEFVRKSLGNNALVAGGKEYSPEGKALYKQALGLLVTHLGNMRLSDFIIKTVDEPAAGSGENYLKALRTMSVIKESGFRTMTTWLDMPGNEEGLGGLVDIRCYGANSYHYIPTPEAAKAVLEHCAKLGKEYWYYAPGCYSWLGTYQEGNIINNRFMSGILFWRSGANGCIAWTFNRPDGDPFNDFDGSRFEPKDFCMVYDALSPTDLFIPTIQWDGFREGVTDYQYFFTLSERIKAALKSKNPAQVRMGEAIQKEFESLLAKVPWRHTERDRYPASLFPNANAATLRKDVSSLILKLDPSWKIDKPVSNTNNEKQY
jgi:hypothetical protein